MTDAEIVETLAARVMGWRVIKSLGKPWLLSFVTAEEDLAEGFRASMVHYPAPPEDIDGTTFDPLTSISDAFMVVEKMREKGWSVMMANDRITPNWAAVFGRDAGLELLGEVNTACRAICLAAIESAEPRGEQ